MLSSSSTGRAAHVLARGVVIAATLALSAAGACGGGGTGGGTSGGTTPPPTQPTGPDATQYVNPMLNADFPDPGIVRGGDGAYYAYATQTAGLRIQVSRSTDLVTWSAPAEAMPAKPAWAQSSGNFWAPDVALRDGRYVMYYSTQADTSNGNFCIGMAQSPSPTGPFTDVGHPVVCGGGFTTIDPQGFDDPQTNKRYLYWGSDFAPIQVQELAADRASFAPGSSATPVVLPRRGQPYENLVEGTWVTYHAPYYYLFYSGDNCCGDVSKVHYAVMVGRASSPTGPFEFLRASANGPAVPVLSAGNGWIAPGHNSVIHAGNDDWMLYHAISVNNPYLIPGRTDISRRPMLLDRITYQANGWPIVGLAGTPTNTPQTKPTVP